MYVSYVILHHARCNDCDDFSVIRLECNQHDDVLSHLDICIEKGI